MAPERWSVVQGARDTRSDGLKRCQSKGEITTVGGRVGLALQRRDHLTKCAAIEHRSALLESSIRK